MSRLLLFGMAEEDLKEERQLRKKSHGSGKRGADKRERRVADVGYLRVIAIKKDKDFFFNLLKKYDSIPSASGSSGILHIFSGEKKEVILVILSPCIL